MRRTVISAAVVLLALAAVGTAGVAFAQDSGQPAPSDDSGQTIAVSGDGTATAAPDKAMLRVAVVAEGDDPSVIRDDLAQGAENLRSALADANLDDDQISTAEYNIRERRPYPREEERDRPDYHGVHVFEVELDDTDRVGAVVDAAANSSAEVQNIEFTLAEDTRDDVRDEALENAVDDADRQAETLATASNLDVTGVHSVDATDRQFRPVRMSPQAYTAEDAAATPTAGTSIDAGDVEVEVTVRVVYTAAG